MLWSFKPRLTTPTIKEPKPAVSFALKLQAFSQTVLIGCGMIALLPAIGTAVHGWIKYHAAGGAITTPSALMLCSPLICLALIAVGLIWSRFSRRHEPRRPAWKVTESGGASE